MSNKHNEKLYCLNGSAYIQFDGQGIMPEELASFVNNNRGEYPPFMHLPDGKVDFRLENGGTISWPGHGALPEAVINYVKDNGVLPRYNDGIEDAFDDCNDDDWDYEDESEDEEWMD